MSYEVDQVDVWVVSLEDYPGALAAKLATLEQAGANLDLVVVRPDDYDLGSSVLFVAPIEGASQELAAQEGGFRKAQRVHTIRIIGPNRPRLGVDVATALSGAGINISAATGAGLGEQAVLYLRVMAEDDVKRGIQILSSTLG